MRVLDRLVDTPALVMTDLGETLAQNRLAVILLGDHAQPIGDARSVIYRWFTDPTARDRYPIEDHDHEGQALVADLRAAFVRRGQDAQQPWSTPCEKAAQSSRFCGTNTESACDVATTNGSCTPKSAPSNCTARHSSPRTRGRCSGC
jgi:MmyB-like transcription regulator ligand binding domain